METRQFAEAAKVFLQLEQKASREGKLIPLSRFPKQLESLVIALAELSLLGDKIFWLKLNEHRLIEYHYYSRAKTFLEDYYLQGRKKRYLRGTYESLAQVCMAAKELYDNGY
jgi:hypothetical protein